MTSKPLNEVQKEIVKLLSANGYCMSDSLVQVYEMMPKIRTEEQFLKDCKDKGITIISAVNEAWEKDPEAMRHMVEKMRSRL